MLLEGWFRRYWTLLGQNHAAGQSFCQAQRPVVGDGEQTLAGYDAEICYGPQVMTCPFASLTMGPCPNIVDWTEFRRPVGKINGAKLGSGAPLM